VEVIAMSDDVKKWKLSDLFGALPATRPFPGKEVIREEVGRAFGYQETRTVTSCLLVSKLRP
jgi:hypothetical protein